MLRLVHWKHWDADADPGARLQRGAMTEEACTTKGYGASFWLHRDEVSPDGIEVSQLDAADPRFERYGVLRIHVDKAAARGVYFAHTEADGRRYPAIAAAHVTLGWPKGFDGDLRDELLDLFEADVIREPTPPDP